MFFLLKIILFIEIPQFFSNYKMIKTMITSNPIESFWKKVYVN